MKRSLVVVSLVGLVLAGVASAEVRKGDVQLDFLAGWTQQQYADTAGGGQLNVYFGALRPALAVTDNIRVGVVGSITHLNVTSGGASAYQTVWAAGVSGEYVFMPANILNPYVGAQLAYATGKGTNFNGLVPQNASGWLWGPRVGALYTLNTANNLFGEFQYQMWEGGLRKNFEHGFVIVFGIEHKFKVGS